VSVLTHLLGTLARGVCLLAAHLDRDADPVATLGTVAGRLEPSAVMLSDPSGREVARIAHDEDALEPSTACFAKHLAQGPGRQTPPAARRSYPVADVAALAAGRVVLGPKRDAAHDVLALDDPPQR